MFLFLALKNHPLFSNHLLTNQSIEKPHIDLSFRTPFRYLRGVNKSPLKRKKAEQNIYRRCNFHFLPLTVFPHLPSFAKSHDGASKRLTAQIRLPHELLSSAEGLVWRRHALRYVVTGLKTVTTYEDGYPSKLMSSVVENTSEGSGLRC